MFLNIKGVDISNNNSINNLSTIKDNNVEYVYLKATEGTTFQDKTSYGRYEQTKELGLKVGFYHFLVSTSEPENQAINFFEYIKDLTLDLIPMLDVELSFDGLCNYVIRFINKFRELSGINPGIYTYSGFISCLDPIKEDIRNLPLWIANYRNDYNKVNTGFFNNVVGWQYSENDSIGYFTGDCNLFSEGCLLIQPGEWILDQEGWWYKHTDGSYTRNSWEKINDKWYLFDDRGYMLYGWQLSSGNNWYYLGNKDDGAMKTGWIFQNNKWYYLDDDGAMKTGWNNIEGKWYYLDNDGAMKTGWINDNGKDYLLYSNGEMARNINIYGYSIDDSGVATKIQQ